MTLTRISVTLLLLVGIMSVTFAAPDQIDELEKSNENGDAQDVYVAAERTDRPVELNEEDENGDVQHGKFYCFRRLIRCRRRCHSSRCRKRCKAHYRRCRRRVTQDDEERIQQDFATPDEPEAVETPNRIVELEEEDENGDVQHSVLYCHRRLLRCRRPCSSHYCLKGCSLYYRNCRRSVTQDDKGNIDE